MAQQSVRFEQFFAAPRETVFAWFARHENLGVVFRSRVRRIRAADDPAEPNGLGSVREVRMGLVRLEETITRFEAPTCIEYRVTRGWAVHQHLGRLMFEAVAGGTRLDYTIEFESRLPFAGGLVAASLCASWRNGVQRAVEAISRT